ncbi:hypothetical protein [Pararhizobium sp.]|uniref:hypothetical protein n=1 Tax=Pararhizobium sp. TaxID=1977563 RepID=UPI003D0B24D3
MSEQQSPTKIICDRLAIGWQTGFDLSVTITPIAASGDIERNWNGKYVDLSEPEFRLFSVRITSGDAEMRAPALARLWPGTVFTIVPSTPFEDMIPVGGTTVVFERLIHPGSVRCLDLEFNDVPFTVVGRTVTLSSPAATPVRVSARYELEVIVTEPWSITDQETKASVSWSLGTEEVGGII